MNDHEVIPVRLAEQILNTVIRMRRPGDVGIGFHDLSLPGAPSATPSSLHEHSARPHNPPACPAHRPHSAAYPRAGAGRHDYGPACTNVLVILCPVGLVASRTVRAGTVCHDRPAYRVRSVSGAVRKIMVLAARAKATGSITIPSAAVSPTRPIPPGSSRIFTSAIGGLYGSFRLLLARQWSLRPDVPPRRDLRPRDGHPHGQRDRENAYGTFVPRSRAVVPVPWLTRSAWDGLSQ
jgi:hypothetical protein